MLGDNLKKFVDYFEEYIKKSEAVDTKNIGIELGSVFSDKFKKASTPEEVSALMLEANKYAIATGNPQLASMFQNLGQIKTMELQQMEKTEGENILAGVSQNYGNEKVLYNGEYIPLKQTKEFQDALNLPARLQPVAIANLQKQYETDVTRTPTYDDKTGEFGLTIGVYTKSDPSNLKITQRLLSYKDKFYEEDETPGYQGSEKLVGEPPEITELKTKLALRKKDLEAMASMRDRETKFSAPFQAVINGESILVTADKDNNLYRSGFGNKSGAKLTEEESAQVSKYYAGSMEKWQGTEAQYQAELTNYNQNIEHAQGNLLAGYQAALTGKVSEYDDNILAELMSQKEGSAPGYLPNLSPEVWEELKDKIYIKDKTGKKIPPSGITAIKGELARIRYEKKLFEKNRTDWVKNKKISTGKRFEF